MLSLAACDGSVTEPELPDAGATFTVAASSADVWALVDPGNPARVVEASDPGASAAWDLGFQATRLMLNGGTRGPAGMVAYYLCQNAGATSEQIMAMTRLDTGRTRRRTPPSGCGTSGRSPRR